MGFSIVTMFFCLAVVSGLVSLILFFNYRNFASKALFNFLIMLSISSAIINISLFSGSVETTVEKTTPITEYNRCINNSSGYSSAPEVIQQCSESVNKYFNSVYELENRK